ncbi:MAG: HNH endonuclease [Phycisphaeraceae bacterium]|nr:HNH endonuclease [Phycisphaeraceae bacterium]
MSAASAISRDGPTEVVMTVKQRRGQRFFRASVLAGHDGKCCITGITHPEMLRASHIVPWKDDAKLRLNPRNGLCLNALHDAAFDRGLFTLTDACEVRHAKRLKKGLPREVWDGMFAKHEG